MIIATHGIVASQILTVPVATAATSVGDTSFTANWNAYSGATYYLLDVSTSSSFSSYVLQNQIVTSNSYNVTGLSSNTTYYYRVRASTTGDGDAELFFQRVNTAGGSLTTTEKSAVTTLVQDLKSYSIWSKMKAIYPMVGASSAACSQNLKSSSFTGSFSSGWTFASTGVTPNGTSATFNTNFNPVTQSLNVNSNHLAVYLRTINTQQSYVDIGQNNNEWLSAIRWGGDSTYIYNPTNTYSIQAFNNNALNLSLNTRRSSTDFVYFQNNSKLGTITASNSSNFANANVHVGSAGGSSFYSARQNAFASIGDGLTDTEASNFYTAVQAFQTSLSRNV